MIPVLLAMALWAIVHSYTAGQFKTAFRERFGERAYHGLYRILYNLFAGLSLAPIMLLVIIAPSGVVWNVPLEWEPALLAIQAVGLLGAALSLLQIDVLRFLGLRQAWAYITGAPLPLPDEPFQAGGVYGLVRHPLYFFSLLASWPVTTMTGAYLGWCIGLTAYFLIGSRLEERRLAAAFGETYAHYRARVPWMLPLPRPRS
jgi:protein-S-isoprenylcysteine O-methyltransferase Ste14